MNAYYYLDDDSAPAVVVAESAIDAALLLTQTLGKMGHSHPEPLKVDRFVRIDLDNPRAIILAECDCK